VQHGTLEDRPAADAARAIAVPLIGLTGSMGAGKSTALDAMSELGAEVLSTDKVVHALFGCERVRRALVERWGPEIAPGDVVARDAVAERVFGNAREREWLEGTIWPLVGERVAAWLALARAKVPAPRAAVVEMPLLFESGMDKACDATIAVLASEELRRQRAWGRGHARQDERVARQLPQEEKARLATYAVCNDGTPDELRIELAAVLDELTTPAG
jgi:dephospho-CoA kinase